MKGFFKNIQSLLIVVLVIIILIMRSCDGGSTPIVKEPTTITKVVVRYDTIKDVFIPPKPWNSWVLDETTYKWKAPVDYPIDENVYLWNEETTSWDVATG